MNTKRPHTESNTALINNNKALQHYYKLHSRIYDVTRWSFLFGRRAIVAQAATLIQPKHILEVGCGTGKNLANLVNTFPEATITGVDVSPDMLAEARRKPALVNNRIKLLHQSYPFPKPDGQKYDLILFAYALSMFNPGWDTAINAAVEDLNEGGLLAVVDFHRSSFAGFRRWMGINHVRMEGHLLPHLKSKVSDSSYKIFRAYGGLWEYVLFIGHKPVLR